MIISGKLGNKVYYYRKDSKNRKHYFVRPAPQEVTQTTATKKAATDFGTASKCSCLIRRALKEYITDKTAHYRLNKVIGDILRADKEHPAGQRQLLAANMHLLNGFQFNKDIRATGGTTIQVKMNDFTLTLLQAPDALDIISATGPTLP
jgi:hypothetical protein